MSPKKRRPRTRDAAAILDRVIGRDRALRARIEAESLGLRVAQQLHDARVAAGLTQSQLAELVGTTQSVISRLEDAEYEGHSLSMLQRVAQALHRRIEIRLVPDVA
jgi:ribosome-binding protein aMBF1 (putative translation factor)